LVGIEENKKLQLNQLERLSIL